MGDPLYYLTLAEYGRCPKLSHRNEWRRGAWDKGCTDIMYMSNRHSDIVYGVMEYPNHPMIFLHNQGEIVRIWVLSQYVVYLDQY